MKQYEIIKRETAWEGKFLRCVIVTYKDAQGIERQWEAVERHNCDGIVTIVPITDDNHIILIRQFRPPLGSFVIEFPAGLNDRGEPHEVAALRELIEETGYEAKELTFLTRGPLSSGSSREQLMVYLARGLEFKGIGQQDETEDIEVLKIPSDAVYEELQRFTDQGDFVDLKVPGLIEMARRRMKES